MNVYRFGTDMLHVLSICLFIYSLIRSKSLRGISLKTQELSLLAFCARYLDVFTVYYSLYNTTMKILYIGTGVLICCLIRFNKTYDAKADRFARYRILIPCALIALVMTSRYTVARFLWTFSLYLGAAALIPQLVLTSRVGKTEALTPSYMLCLGLYVAFHVANWVYRYQTNGFFFLNAWLSAFLQVCLYGVFLFFYTRRVRKGKRE